MDQNNTGTWHDDDDNKHNLQELETSLAFTRLNKEYTLLLTKLVEMAFILKLEYKYIEAERDKDRTELLFSEAEQFVLHVASTFEKQLTNDYVIVSSIQNWDNLGTDQLVSDINHWMSWFMKENLDKSKLNEVEEFICQQQLSWLKSLAS
jgi:hypothetical protein